MRHRGDDQEAVVLEADEATVKKMVNAWRQEQAVFSIQALLIGRIAPGLAMTGHQVHWVLNTCETASGFNFADSLLEEPLTHPSSHNSLAFGLTHGDVGGDVQFQLALPEFQII